MASSVALGVLSEVFTSDFDGRGRKFVCPD